MDNSIASCAGCIVLVFLVCSFMGALSKLCGYLILGTVVQKDFSLQQHSYLLY